jgi:hypothetical protein
MAVIGALFFGSPIPRWMTGWPFSRNSLASSFNRKVGESAMDLASWEMLIENPSSSRLLIGCRSWINARQPLFQFRGHFC